jgi:hypothetical protein
MTSPLEVVKHLGVHHSRRAQMVDQICSHVHSSSEGFLIEFDGPPLGLGMRKARIPVCVFSSNFQRLYKVRYSGEALDATAISKPLETIKDIKNFPMPGQEVES